MKISRSKGRLKPLSFHGHKPETVLKAFMQVDPRAIKDDDDKEKQKTRMENTNVQCD